MGSQRVGHDCAAWRTGTYDGLKGRRKGAHCVWRAKHRSSWFSVRVLQILKQFTHMNSVQLISAAQSCPTLCDPMDCSTPGFLVQPCPSPAPEVTQTHVHRVCDAIQPSHPLSSPSPPAFNLSEPGSFQMSQFFASGGQSTGVSASASLLPMNTQD